jgi:hypothetical protein
MQFKSASAVPKYLNFATFSDYVLVIFLGYDFILPVFSVLASRPACLLARFTPSLFFIYNIYVIP